MKRKRGEAPPETKPAGKVLMWLVVITAAAALVLMLRLAREILAELQSLGGTGGAQSTRLLTGLFVTMCFAGFTAAALWAALKKVLGRDAKKDQ